MAGAAGGQGGNGPLGAPPPPLLACRLSRGLRPVARSPSPARLQGCSEDDEFPFDRSACEGRVRVATECDRRGVDVVVTAAPVAGRLQEGPNCGLVALAMGAQWVLQRHGSGRGVASTRDLLSIAQQHGYSREGEMFSVDDLAALARSGYGDSLSVSVQRPWCTNRLVDAVVGGCMVLVPYDNGRDGLPVNAGGARAHWALVVGVAVRRPGEGTVCWGTADDVYQAAATAKEDDMYVLCRHGRTRHVAVWDVRRLRESNAGLRRASDEKRGQHGRWVIPERLDKTMGSAFVVIGIGSASCYRPSGQKKKKIEKRT